MPHPMHCWTFIILSLKYIKRRHYLFKHINLHYSLPAIIHVGHFRYPSGQYIMSSWHHGASFFTFFIVNRRPILPMYQNLFFNTVLRLYICKFDTLLHSSSSCRTTNNDTSLLLHLQCYTIGQIGLQISPTSMLILCFFLYLHCYIIGQMLPVPSPMIFLFPYS